MHTRCESTNVFSFIGKFYNILQYIKWFIHKVLSLECGHFIGEVVGGMEFQFVENAACNNTLNINDNNELTYLFHFSLPANVRVRYLVSRIVVNGTTL